MTPEDPQQQSHFKRVLSDPLEQRPQWAYPYAWPTPEQDGLPSAQEQDWQPLPPVEDGEPPLQGSGWAAKPGGPGWATTPGAFHSRGIELSDLNNIPIHQQQQTLMSDEQWARYMAEEIDLAWRPIFVKHNTIFPVPQALFEVRPRSYCPRIVTVGPLSRKLEPSPMDTCKALCIKEFMARQGIHLDELMNHTIPEPHNLRSIYFGLPKYNIETVKFLVTVDSVFIHEFLFLMMRDFDHEDETCGYLYSFLNNQITIAQVTRDLFLIGNQVPMSFLKRLTELPKQDFTLDNLEQCLEYLVWRSNPFCMSHLTSNTSHTDLMELVSKPLLDCEHLLDCLYAACVRMPDGSTSQEFNRPSFNLPTASDLSRVGIKFKARKGNTSVIRYHKSSLRLDLPRLVVFDETEDILRNLVAYELTSKAGGELCGYAIIMDSLIDTADDLAILYRAGVLVNHLGSDKRLLRMWNEMCNNITESSCERWEVMTEAIMMHYRSNWRVMYVEFYSKFFSRPWLWLSSIAAILLLGMSALQTIYSVMSYYHG